MQAGRELDALVAEKVMGVHITWVDSQGHTVPTVQGQPFHIKPYSTDIAAAWEVVEKLGDDVYIRLVSPCTRCGVKAAYWECGQIVPDDYGTHTERSVLAEADTAPHAICLAALKALGAL